MTTHENGRRGESRKRDCKRRGTSSLGGRIDTLSPLMDDSLGDLREKCRAACNPLGFAASSDTKGLRPHENSRKRRIVQTDTQRRLHAEVQKVRTRDTQSPIPNPESQMIRFRTMLRFRVCSCRFRVRCAANPAGVTVVGLRWRNGVSDIRKPTILQSALADSSRTGFRVPTRSVTAYPPISSADLSSVVPPSENSNVSSVLSGTSASESGKSNDIRSGTVPVGSI